MAGATEGAATPWCGAASVTTSGGTGAITVTSVAWSGAGVGHSTSAASGTIRIASAAITWAPTDTGSTNQRMFAS